jgi:hypothetical protein
MVGVKDQKGEKRLGKPFSPVAILKQVTRNREGSD